MSGYGRIMAPYYIDQHCRMSCFAILLLLISLSGVHHVRAAEFGDFRMLETDVPNSGPIEIYWQGSFTRFCDRFITVTNAMMICRHLALPSKDVSLNNPEAVEGISSPRIRCDGDESSLNHCAWAVLGNISMCDNALGITCGGPIRRIYARPDRETTSGVVEVYYDNEWTRVCGDTGDFRLARVMCGEIDDYPYLTPQGYQYDNGSVPAVSISCLGNETSHVDCIIEPAENCDKLFGIQCNATDSYQDMLNSTDTEGQYTVYVGLYTPCSLESNITDDEVRQRGNAVASVMCFQHGLFRHGAEMIVPEGVSVPRVLLTFDCTGQEDQLEQCTTYYHVDRDIHYCYTGIGDVYLQCAAPIRLVGGVTDYDGWVELRQPETSEWQPMVGPISTSHMVGQLLCRQLGLDSGDVAHLTIELVNDDIRPEFVVEYVCNGTERTLIDCEKRRVIDPTIPVGRLGLNCNGIADLGLANIENKMFRIRSFSGTQTPETEGSRSSNKVANVLCHQFGFQRNRVDVATSLDRLVFAKGVANRWCIGIENSVEECLTVIDNQKIFTVPFLSTTLEIKCYGTDECQTGYAAPVVGRNLTCNQAYCLDNTCPFFGTAFCDGACQVRREYISVAGSLTRSDILTCGDEDECESFYYGNKDGSSTSSQCCFTDLCNRISLAPLSSAAHTLSHGFTSYDGLLTVELDGERIAIKDDANIPEAFLIALCGGAGLITTFAGRVPGYPTDHEQPEVSTCITNIDYSTCTEFSSNITRCGGTTEPCDNNRLNIHCNAVSPIFRLSDGPSETSGRVEIFLNDQWGTVCSRGFTPNATDVICRSLGFPGGCSSYWMKSPYKMSDLPVHISDISCHGDEMSMWYCNYTLQVPRDECGSDSVIAIMCEEGSAPPMETTTPPPTTTVATNTNLTGDIRCYEGECATAECTKEATKASLVSQTKCTFGQSTNCYITQRDTMDGERVPTRLIFGCTRGCSIGLKNNANSTLTYCCNSDLCNYELDTLITMSVAERPTNTTDNGSSSSFQGMFLSFMMFVTFSLI